MPNPKTRHSKQRKRQRRTHYKLEAPNLTTCAATGEVHLMHRAYKHDGDTYYRGRVLIKGPVVEESEE
ncbi:MAG: 50S ribosomal protein L32 [Saprospiraceae bacterium]|jgi:large subunit ribosomal protein L32|nr:50S ribosomal protein L32 [Saprospiraceae bacterium]MBL0190728.1 50S ribosomal protein L32 [Saprospiraceae bacterium]MBL0293032.1 50S ribosomal protein L32 [Saprospiraceae bacterium]